MKILFKFGVIKYTSNGLYNAINFKSEYFVSFFMSI